MCLCPFSELGLTTPGAMADQWAGHLGRPADEQQAKARAVASSEPDLERGFFVPVARLSVRNAADRRLLCSMAYPIFKFEATFRDLFI